MQNHYLLGASQGRISSAVVIRELDFKDAGGEVFHDGSHLTARDGGRGGPQSGPRHQESGSCDSCPAHLQDVTTGEPRKILATPDNPATSYGSRAVRSLHREVEHKAFAVFILIARGTIVAVRRFHQHIPQLVSVRLR